MAVTLTQAYSQLQATVVDLPAVTPLTHKLMGEASTPAGDQQSGVAATGQRGCHFSSKA